MEQVLWKRKQGTAEQKRQLLHCRMGATMRLLLLQRLSRQLYLANLKHKKSQKPAS